MFQYPRNYKQQVAYLKYINQSPIQYVRRTVSTLALQLIQHLTVKQVKITTKNRFPRKTAELVQISLGAVSLVRHRLGTSWAPLTLLKTSASMNNIDGAVLIWLGYLSRQRRIFSDGNSLHKKERLWNGHQKGRYQNEASGWVLEHEIEPICLVKMNVLTTCFVTMCRGRQGHGKQTYPKYLFFLSICVSFVNICPCFVRLSVLYFNALVLNVLYMKVFLFK